MKSVAGSGMKSKPLFTEDAIDYCPVCDTVIPDNKEFLVIASTEGHRVEETVMAETQAEAYSKGVKIIDPK